MGCFVVKSQPSGHGLHQGSANFFYREPDSKYFRICRQYDLSSNYRTLSNVKAAMDNLSTNKSGSVPIKLYLYNTNRWPTRFGPYAIVCQPLFHMSSYIRQQPRPRVSKLSPHGTVQVMSRSEAGWVGSVTTWRTHDSWTRDSYKHKCCQILQFFQENQECSYLPIFKCEWPIQKCKPDADQTKPMWGQAVCDLWP